MENRNIDTSLLDRAILFAVQAHSGVERRGKGFPYIVHPLEALSIVAEITADPELLAAAALHDVVEDTPVTLDDLRAAFGLRVAELVAFESDTPGGTWRERKQAAIDRIAAAPLDAKVVAMGDKLSNMRAIARDFARQGDALWDLFHAPGGRPDHEWHYRGLAASLFALCDTDPYREFASLIDQVFGPADNLPPVCISLDDYRQSGAGYNGVSYNHINGVTMVKFYDASQGAAAPQSELRCSRRLVQMGVPTPYPGRLVTDGSRIGSEFRRISPKRSFARLVADDPARAAEVGVRLAAMGRRLHSLPCDTAAFPSAALRCLNVVGQCPLLSDTQRRQAAAFVRSVPECRTCLHGDFHIGNVIVSEGGFCPPGGKAVSEWWIDVGDFGWGNPLFDLGIWYVVAHWLPDAVARSLYHIGTDGLRRVWDAFVPAYIANDSPAAASELEARVLPFAGLRMLCFPEVLADLPDLRRLVWQSLALSGE